jgi:hypothetical protein
VVFEAVGGQGADIKGGVGFWPAKLKTDVHGVGFCLHCANTGTGRAECCWMRWNSWFQRLYKNASGAGGFSWQMQKPRTSHLASIRAAQGVQKMCGV